MIDDRQNFPVPGDFLDETKAQSILQAFGFTDWKAARTIIQRMGLQDRQGQSVSFSVLDGRTRFLCLTLIVP